MFQLLLLITCMIHTFVLPCVMALMLCEKPLVLNPHNIDALELVEKETKKSIYNILQLRLHPSIIQLKEFVSEEVAKNPNKVFEVDLTY